MSKLVLLSVLVLSVLVTFAPSLADAAKPNLVIMPKTANAGDNITITGANFPPDSTVEIFRDGKKITTYDTSRKGSFTATITIPDDAKSGSHKIKVTSADASASGNFEVKKSKAAESKSGDKQKTKQAKPSQKSQPLEDILSEIEQQQKTPKTDQSKRLVNISDKSGFFQVIPNRDLCDEMIEDYVISVKWVTDVKDGSFHALYDVNGKNEIVQIPKGGIKSGDSGLTVQFSGKFAPGEYNFGLSYNNFWVEDSIVKVIIPAPDCVQVQIQGGDIGQIGQGTGTTQSGNSDYTYANSARGIYVTTGQNLCDSDPFDYEMQLYWDLSEYKGKKPKMSISEKNKGSQSYGVDSNQNAPGWASRYENGKSLSINLLAKPGEYEIKLMDGKNEVINSIVNITIPPPACTDQTQNKYVNTGNAPPVKKDIKTTPATPQTPIPQIPESTKHVKTGNTPSTKTTTPEDPRLKEDSSGLPTSGQDDRLSEDSSGLSSSELQVIKNKSGRYNVFAQNQCDDLPNDYMAIFVWNVSVKDNTKFKTALHSESGKYAETVAGSSNNGAVTIQSEMVPAGTYVAYLYFDSNTPVPDSKITVIIPKPNCSGLEDSSGTHLSTRQDVKTEPLTCTPSNTGQWTCTKSETKTSTKSESFNCALSEDNSLTCTSSGAQGTTLNCPVNYYDETIKAWEKCGVVPKFQPSGTTNQGQTSNSGSNTIKIQNKHGTAVQHNTNLCDSDPMDYRVMLLWVIDNPGLSVRDFRVNPVFPLKSLYHSDHKLESGELKQQIFATSGNHEYELTYKGITVANSKIYVTIPTPNCAEKTQTGSTGYKITDKTPSQIRDATKSPPTGSTNPSTPDPQKSTSKSTTTGNKAILVPKTGSTVKPSTGTGLK